MLLEACVNSAVSAIGAWKGGAHRVELCENMADGGCTPSAGTIRYAKQHLDIPVFVMIRPRGGDFLYSGEEFDIMRRDIRTAKDLGADGVVFGILLPDGRIDRERMAVLAGLARPMGITCHRAFDMTRDPFEALETLAGLGIDRILTSGQAENAIDGAPLIRKLIKASNDRIIIMPGRGIREHNLLRAIKETEASEFHMYLVSPAKTRMEFVREAVSMGKSDLPEYSYPLVDAARIRKARKILDGEGNW
jgi:copper homeostasis protein